MDIEAVAARLKVFEGSTNYLYLCPAGKVTCGVGHVIQSLSEALAMPFLVGVSLANIQQITNDYNNIRVAQPGLVVTSYMPYTTIRLSDDYVETILEKDIAAFLGYLHLTWPNFDSFPEPAQEAAFDVAYNVGSKGLTTKFPHLVQAIDAGDWTTAAAQCHRTGIQESRNQETAALFLQAAQQTQGA